MTAPAPGPETEQQTEARMRQVAAELAAAGLEADVHEIQGVLDVRASLRRAAHGPVEVTYDSDGYVVVAFWHAPGATPAQVGAVISGVLGVITGSP